MGQDLEIAKQLGSVSAEVFANSANAMDNVATLILVSGLLLFALVAKHIVEGESK
jgi:hypothetical protein